MPSSIHPRARLFFLAGATLDQHRRSGVHRVVVEMARALAGLTDLQPVRYDPLDGDIRPLDSVELNQLFGPGDWPRGIRLDPRARRVGKAFREGREPARGAWLIVPEVAWQEANGTENLRWVIEQCHAWGVRVAALFYDLLPLERAEYGADAFAHGAYVRALASCDLVMPISQDSGERLKAYWRGLGMTPPPTRPLLLPDGGFVPRPGAWLPRSGEGPIVLVGTVEPRKRQLQFLEAYAAIRARSSAAARRKVVVIGSLGPALADRFKRFVARRHWVEYLDYASDTRLLRAYKEAPFSAFISEDEGYGLPIAESLAVGTPCLCANFGAMAEVARGGGCFTIDVRDRSALESAIVTLLEQPEELARLRGEIAARVFLGWDDYARAILGLLAKAEQ